LKAFVKFHFLPLILAFASSIVLLFALNSIFFSKGSSKATTIKNIKGKQKLTRGVQVNYATGVDAEINFLANIRNKNHLSLMGSSEFADLPYSSYYFLPDSIGIPTVGFGHAYHQSFSIMAEMLAAQKDLKNAKVCIFVSPTWFIVDGTNIEAFLEFVPINFLKSIAKNKDIPDKYKLKIGEFITKNYEHISCTNGILNYYKNLYKTKDIPTLFQSAKNLSTSFESINYEIDLLNSKQSLKFQDRTTLDKKVQTDFLQSIKTNSIFVNDEYYKKFIFDPKVKNPKYDYSKDFFFSNQELEDFTLLIEVLKRYDCDASFIIQPMNPHYYTSMENFNPAINEVRRLIKKNNFPCLDLFSIKKEDFEPGTLNDVMHLGDFGWTKVSNFLVKTYANPNR
jgi:D-alanine transfer protein